MATQSSCSGNRPGYPANGRRMSGNGCSGSYTRPQPFPGCPGSHTKPMPAPDCPGNHVKPMPVPDCPGNHVKPMPIPDCPGNHVKPMPLPETGCGCQDSSPITCVESAEFPVGMTYVPMQPWGPTYNPEKALCQGTLFPDLDKPFLGRRVSR